MGNNKSYQNCLVILLIHVTLTFSEKCPERPESLLGLTTPIANSSTDAQYRTSLNSIMSEAYTFLQEQQNLLKNGCFKPKSCEPISIG